MAVKTWPKNHNVLIIDVFLTYLDPLILVLQKKISALDSWEMEQAIGKDICIIDIITKNISELSNSIIFIPKKSIQNNHLYHYQKQNNW